MSDALDIKVSPEMKEAGAYVLETRYDYATGIIARNLVEEVFDEMLAVWRERHG